ncbi:putative inactive phenolphthiocerol synthesis polyketide synthase type I Pks15 isoform X6 [Boleophthalmus pectinirostris]|uniref:putative inactive phenolphthiocerol synthesis polyketide synthase type I Pks15 isoform X6 n=1 Tax=Boleophthalmus pectinirostris TaxID=150288 RepID=UPI00242FDB60|nr:putative inactive phenolphthiocerol synthesis polyketide synthase type I Pks15 isoform X6 [Boleophthalmus pectinirostris]
MDEPEDSIAVIGIGCNFPGGEGVDNFWRVLVEGRNCASDIPTERFNSTLWYDPDDSKPGKTQTQKAAFINGFNEFDHKFFGIPEAEANFMDPQQKLLLHCTYRALEDAGISMESISGSRTGVIIGLMNRDYETLKSDNCSTINHYNATGTAMSIAANRISFTFNLTGPSFAIDSACSSSLVALHLACQSLKQGDCEMTFCGGVSCIIEPRVFVALSKAKMISPEGISKPFSTKADGYGRGEGCGVVLLKPLKNAICDCNKIWGVISKTAVNQDGHHVSPITRPSMLQQEKLLCQIYSKDDLANVQYIEAHGTGTAIGDPTEAGSIANVIAKAKSATDMLKLGSVKGNIGHTESAAGVAGLIKYRRTLGLAGQSINWGPLNLGLLLNKDNFQKFLTTKGLMVMDVGEVHEALKMCLLMDRVQQMICKFDFKNLHQHVLSQNTFLRKRLSALVQTELKDVLESEAPVVCSSSTDKRVRRIVSDLFHVSVDELNDNTSLCFLGIDSMLAMTLQNKVFQETGVSVPLVKILDPKCTLTTLITAVVNVNM